MRLSVRLALLFVLVGLVPTLTATYINYRNHADSLLAAEAHHLSSVAELKEAELRRWLQSTTLLLESIATRPLVIQIAGQLLEMSWSDSGHAALRDAISSDHLAPHIKAGLIQNLSVLDPATGQIIAATNNLLLGRFRESETFFLEGKTATYIDPIQYSVSSESLVMHISTPIRTQDGRLVGVLAAHLDLPELSRIIAGDEASSLTATQDVYLVNSFAFFVTEPRFGDGYALQQTVKTDGVLAALDGQNGIAEYENYRGVAVVGAYRWLEDLDMALLAESDRAEALAPVRALQRMLAILLASTTACLLLVAFLLARGVSRPVGDLIEGAEQIGYGNLDYKTRVRGSREFRSLADSFNQMADNLKQVTASRDQLDEEIERRKAVEAELRTQWANFETILDGIPHVIYVVDPKTYEVLFVNQHFREMLGESPIGKQCYRAFQGFEKPCEFCTNDILFRTGEPHTWEHFNPIFKKHYLISDRLIRWSDRENARLELAMDVTDRKLAEMELRRSKEITDSIVQSLPGIFYQLTEDGRFVRWNRAFTEITGRTDEEMARAHAIDFFVNDDRRNVAREIVRVFEEGSGEITGNLIAADGTSIPYLFTGMLKTIEETPYLIGMGTDISGLKAAETRLRRSMDELKRSNEELEQFAYVASHDLQEPLRMVSSYTQLLEKRYQDRLDEDAHDFIHYAVDGANRMQQLINDLLAYSRVQTRGRPFQQTDLNEVLGRARANVAAAVEESGGVITNEELPVVPCDALQMVSVFQNLLSNALKFRSDTSPRVHIRVKDLGETWEIAVRDNGVGIDPQYHERVFVIFQRLHARAEYPGTGIGLSLVKRIIERHGGSIRLESTEGNGTTFFITLLKQPPSKESTYASDDH